MPWPEIAVLGGVAAWLALAVLWLCRRKKRGCGGCCGSCASRERCEKKK